MVERVEWFCMLLDNKNFSMFDNMALSMMAQRLALLSYHWNQGSSLCPGSSWSPFVFPSVQNHAKVNRSFLIVYECDFPAMGWHPTLSYSLPFACSIWDRLWTL